MGQVFAGRYELLDPIAEGAMGSIWRVRDRRDDTVKAAKLLRQQDAASLLRFIREQGTRIHHPHVVTPLGWAGEDDAVLFTMPLLGGGSVATLLGDHGALPQRWVVELLDQALAGLAAVHAQGVVHRDVKPGNLLLEPTGLGVPHLRLSDFGVAVPADQPRLTAPSTTLGTPGYMPPEQLEGADPHPSQDLYALGVTGLHLLTGAPPPHDPASLPDTPLARVLRTATDADPARRPQSAQELAMMLRAVTPTGPWDPGEVEVLEHWPSAAMQGTGRLQDSERRSAAPPVAPAVGPDATRPRARDTTGHQARKPWWPIAVLGVLGIALLLTGVLVLT